MRPAVYRKGGVRLRISHVCIDSAFGRLMIAATDRGLCFVQFGSSDEELFNLLRKEFPAAVLDVFTNPILPSSISGSSRDKLTLQASLETWIFR